MGRTAAVVARQLERGKLAMAIRFPDHALWTRLLGIVRLRISGRLQMMCSGEAAWGTVAFGRRRGFVWLTKASTR